MSVRDAVSPEQMRRLLRYEPDTGSLFWLPRPPEMFKVEERSRKRIHAAWNAKHAGKPALNCVSSYGYLHGRVFRFSVAAHQAAWVLTQGHWPAYQIDHINGLGTDNRLCNLREVSHTENARNQKLSRTNTSGHTGVFWATRDKTWIARIVVDKEHLTLGYFDSKEEAVAAREAANKKYGFHPNHGKVRRPKCT